MNKLLEGKVCFISGGTRGIGKAIVETFVAEGAIVHFSYISESSVDKAREMLAEMGEKAFAHQADAANSASIRQVIDAIVEQHGRIDVVVNNAGITQDNLLLRMSEEQWQKVLDTNLNSVFFASKAALKPMLKQRSGSFINMSSVVGVQGNAGQANYAASKAGIVGFTKSLAREVGSRNIRANVVAPGFIGTEMTGKIPEKELESWLKNIPLQRAGSTKDVADLCLFLASDLSTYITGQVLHVDGGMVMA